MVQFFIAGLKNEAVHGHNNSSSFSNRMQPDSIECFRKRRFQGVPIPTINAVKIFGIDDGGLPLCERDKSVRFIERLRNLVTWDSVFPAFLGHWSSVKGLMFAAAILTVLGFSSPAKATQYFISFSSGNNSNNGTSEATPWKSHPYMQSAAGCGGSLPTYSHTAGDIFIFKQGDTWPNACFDMVIAAGGVGSPTFQYDTYTFDPLWGTAGGTTGNAGQNVGVYKFDASASAINGTDTLNEFIHIPALSYIVFNGMELTRQVWTTTGLVSGIDVTTSTNITISNIYAHGWTHSGASLDTLNVIEGNNGPPFNSSVTVFGSVFDGANSGGAGVANSGTPIWNIPDAHDNIAKNMANGILLNANGLAYNNTVGPVNASFDGTVRTLCLSPITMIDGGYSLVYLYNNIVHDCAGVPVLTQGAAANSGREFDYLWNNVVFVGSVGSPQVPVQFDSISTQNVSSSVYAWNNTIVGGTSVTCMATINRSNGNFQILQLINNHCISNQGIVTLNITATTYTNTTNLLMSTATATAQGYTSSETYAYSPAASGNGTVGAGTNLESTAINQFVTLQQDTTYGGVRGPNTHPPTVAWDVGAYQFVVPLSGTFYVDNCVTVGNDSNNGISPATPWLTIARVNDAAFNPNASVLFQSTCQWRERLTPPSSGTSGNPVVFSSYGSGSLPVISGALLLTGWISGAPVVHSFQVSTNNDNAYDDGTFINTGTPTLAIASFNSTTRTGGTLFENVAIPQGTSIYSAVWQGNIFPGDPMNVTVYGDDEDNAANFSATTGATCVSVPSVCPKNRPKTSQNVLWAPTNFGYQPANVTSIAQAILNRPGWTSGNSMAILTSSQNTVTAIGRIYSDTFPNVSAQLAITIITPTTNVYAVPFTWTDKFDPAGPLWFDGVQVSTGAASLGALTANNEWYYDYANLAPYLYIYSTTNPATRTIEVADPAKNSALFINAKQFVNVSALSFQKSRQWNVEVSGGANIAFQNIESTLGGSIGLNVERGSSSIAVTGGSVHDNGGIPQGDNDGVAVGGLGSNSTPVTITGVDIYNNVNDGIETYSPAGGTIAVTGKFNLIHNNLNHGWQVDGPGVQSATIQSNVLYGNGGSGIDVAGTGTFTLTVYNNTIATSTGDGVLATEGTWLLKNNLLYNNGHYEVEAPSTVTSFTSDYNDFYHAAGGNFMSWSGTAATFAGWQSASSQDSNSLSTDPLVANAGANNYTIAGNSPLVDVGTSLGSTYQFALLPASTWPNGVQTGVQNNYGQGWNLGAFLLPVSGQIGTGSSLNGGSIH